MIARLDSRCASTPPFNHTVLLDESHERGLWHAAFVMLAMLDGPLRLRLCLTPAFGGIVFERVVDAVIPEHHTPSL